MGRKNSGCVVIGYELNDDYAQISYYVPDGEDAETLAVVAGTEQYNIPMALCRKKDANQWLFGKDALRLAKEQGGFLVERLPELARKGSSVMVGEESFDPVALLTLFIRRSLAMLGIIAPLDYIGGIMFTTEQLEERMVEVLLKVAANLHLKTEQIYFQSHMESFYEYMLHQPEGLWLYDALLCDYDNKRLKTYTFSCNRKTTPKVVFIDTKEYEGMEREPDEKGELPKAGLDERFLEIMKEKCNGQALSSVYLIGDGYKDQWASESLRYLCSGRRAFQGNNLYSKGACYSIRKKLGVEEDTQEYVFLGDDKLAANIGMRLLRKGEESYFAIMDAGVNWYEAKKDFELILEGGDTIAILLTPLNGEEPKEINMILEGLPSREAWTTRLRIEAQMLSARKLCLMVRDMGFGEFFPASGGEWMKQFEIV